MHPVELISAAIKGDPENCILPTETVDGICALTGVVGPCVPRGELLGKSFTNGDLLARPESDLISVDSYVALKYKWERMSSWFCDGHNFERLDRIGVRDKVFNPNMPPQWTAYATTSYKKHGALNAKVNKGKSRIWHFEMRVVDLTETDKVMEWWGVLNVALRNDIGRSVIESLDCPPYLIGKIGLNIWVEFECWARPKYNSALYSFLCYLLPSQEELKCELA